MGFKPERLEYDLSFEGDLEGLEVTMRSVSLEQYLKASAAHRLTDVRGRAWTAEDKAAMTDLYEAFADALESWNVEDDNGDPVPAGRAGVFAQDLQFLLPVALAWLRAMAGIEPDLGKDLSSGGISPEASLPMEALSPSPAS
jgi:hypothetical protein